MSHRGRLSQMMAKAAGRREATDADRLFEAIVANESFLSTRARLATKLQLGGSGQDGDRDYVKELRYPQVVTVETYREWWEGDGLANRVVGVYADECWATDPEVYDTESDRQTKFIRAFKALDAEIDLLGALQTTDEVSGIGGYGVAFIALQDGKTPDQPAAGLDAQGRRTDKRPEGVECVAVVPLDQTQARIAEYDSDPTSRRAGLPTYYDLSLHDPTGDSGLPQPAVALGKTTRVHWSRVVHVPSSVRSGNRLFGFPMLKGVFHRVFDVRWKLAGGSAEMYWQGALPGYAFEENESELDTQPIDKASLDQEFDLFLNRLQRYLAVQGGKVKSLAPQVSDPGPHIIQQFILIAAAIKCPTRVLLGTEQGQNAGEKDDARWNKRVFGRCLRYCDRKVLRPVVTRLQALGVLPETSGLMTSWKDVSVVSEKDVADIGMKTTQSLLQYITSGAFLLVPPFEYMVNVLRWSEGMAKAVIEKAGGEEKMVAALTKQLEMTNQPASAQNGQGKVGGTGSGGKRNGLGK